MYALTHNPPSDINQYNFSGRTFRYPYRHSQGSKQQGKNELHRVLCAQALPHVSFERRICDVGRVGRR